MPSTASTVSRIRLDRTWTDEHGIVHALFRHKTAEGVCKRSTFLVCTNNVIPRWGIDLAEQNTFDKATCLWCVAEELQPVETS